MTGSHLGQRQERTKENERETSESTWIRRVG